MVKQKRGGEGGKTKKGGGEGGKTKKEGTGGRGVKQKKSGSFSSVAATTWQHSPQGRKCWAGNSNGIFCLFFVGVS